MNSDRVANKDEQWPSSIKADCGQNDRHLWKQYLPLRSVTRQLTSWICTARFKTVPGLVSAATTRCHFQGRGGKSLHELVWIGLQWPSLDVTGSLMLGWRGVHIFDIQGERIGPDDTCGVVYLLLPLWTDKCLWKHYLPITLIAHGSNMIQKQECIPVGCVPSAVSSGVCLPGCVCVCPGGRCLPRGRCLPWGCIPRSGGCLPRQMYSPLWTDRHL